jgi:hypothetical protein
MKKYFIKVSFSFLSLIFLSLSIWNLCIKIPNGIQSINYWKNEPIESLKNEIIKELSIDMFQSISYFLVAVLFFLVVNFKGLQFVTISATQLIKEHNSKENKRAKLSQEIAKKQAELDKLNNEPKTE